MKPRPDKIGGAPDGSQHRTVKNTVMPDRHDMPDRSALQLITHDDGIDTEEEGLNPGRARTTTLAFR
jgi:hypothetical protein